MNLTELLRSRIVDVPDFPIEGVMFKDITPLLADHEAFVAAVDAVVKAASSDRIDKVVGIEARGFLLAAPAAYHLGAGFVPVRKPGKLPGPTRETSYILEYGSNVLQVPLHAFAPDDRVLVVDDVLATGGTASAAGRLVRDAGAHLVGFSVLLELASLGGRALLSTDHPAAPVHALLTY